MQNVYHLRDEQSHNRNLQIIYSRNFSQIKIHVFIIKLAIHCQLWLCICELIFVIPENIHTHPKDSDLKFQGTVGSQK